MLLLVRKVDRQARTLEECCFWRRHKFTICSPILGHFPTFATLSVTSNHSSHCHIHAVKHCKRWSETPCIVTKRSPKDQVCDRSDWKPGKWEILKWLIRGTNFFFPKLAIFFLLAPFNSFKLRFLPQKLSFKTLFCLSFREKLIILMKRGQNCCNFQV